MMLYNRNEGNPITITTGERCAQIVFIKTLTTGLKQIYHMPESVRGNQGFGSSGLYVTTPATKRITSTDHKEDLNTSKHSYKTGEELTSHQKLEIRHLVTKYEDIFATTFKDIKGARTNHYHDIDTGNAKPVKKKPYRIPYQYIDWLKKELETMEANGIIQKSHSPWAAPLLIVPKKGDGEEFSPRAVIDYRWVNELLLKDGYPMPRTDDILAQMSGNPRFFSILDLFS